MYIQLDNFGSKSSLKSLFEEGVYSCVERIHQFPEIVLVMDGEVVITVDGVEEVARRGDMAVITPFRTHSFRTPEYCNIWIGVISGDLAGDFLGGDKIYSRGERAVFTPSHSLFEYVRSHLPKEYGKPIVLEGDEAYRSVKALTYVVFEEYMRLVPNTLGKIENNALASTLLYISAHFTENISLESVAKALGYSPTHISHSISVIPGVNFRKLVNSLRVDRAKPMIIEGKLRMLDIALECGFSGERSFNRAFLDIAGVTPSEYRKEKLSGD
ncbi:MAG: helix-turn-helix domain-containing protein [Clostridia bacterium]|nr:helix-turn-helix domain-containing protein [Clostridia bacterium]